MIETVINSQLIETISERTNYSTQDMNIYWIFLFNALPFP